MVNMREIGVQFVGIVMYLGGLLMLLMVVLSVYLAPPQHSFGNLSLVHLLLITASLVFIIGGRMLGWRYGSVASFNTVPNGLTSVYQFNQFPVVEQPDIDDRFHHSKPQPRKVMEDGVLYAICQECGTKNESEYTFCGNCSTKLPG